MLEISVRRSRGIGGYAQTYALGVPPIRRFLISIAGPLASAFVATLLWIVASDVHGISRHLLMTAAGVATFQALLNMLPFDFVDGRTISLDGKNALQALKSAGFERRHSRPAIDGSSNAPFIREFNATWTRWFALISRETSPVHHPLRSRALAVCALVSDVAPASPEAIALTKLAKAGWCWREVERGDPTAINDEVQQAMKRAAQTGAVRPEVQVRAACQLLANPDALADASPGRDDQERRGFLNRASRSALPAREGLDFTPEQQRMAFMYGVALHDVERIEPIELGKRQLGHGVYAALAGASAASRASSSAASSSRPRARKNST